MKALPQEYVYDVLFRFQTDYRKQFYNICRIILRHILVHMMCEKGLERNFVHTEYERLEEIVLQHDKSWMKMLLMDYLQKLIQEKYDNDIGMKNYLSADINDFVSDLYAAVLNGYLKKIVV